MSERARGDFRRLPLNNNAAEAAFALPLVEVDDDDGGGGA